MNDLDIAVKKILDEDDDVGSEKEQNSMDGAQSSAKDPTYKFPEPSLGETIALLREAIKLHTTQNIGLGSKSKVDTTLSLSADSGSTNSGRLVADPAKSCCSPNNVSNTLTADCAIPCDTNIGAQCANENSDNDYLSDISLEYENIERKGPPSNEKLTKIFQDLIWSKTKPDKIGNLLKSVLPPENIESLGPNKVNIEVWRTISHQTKSADLKLQDMQALVQKFFAVIANVADDLYKNRTEKDEKVISQTIKDSIRKCADAAVFLGKIKPRYFKFKEGKDCP